MPNMNQDIFFKFLLLQTTMPSAWRHLAEYSFLALPPEETQAVFEGGHGTAPDLIYAGGISDTTDHGQTNFDKRLCTLILIEIGFS